MKTSPALLPSQFMEQQALKKVILTAALSSLIMFLPFIIQDGGRFSLISDFNHQQIPFNMHSAWALKTGQAQWDWYTDLGVNFIGAFSFYTLGSPFFWLSMLFPPEAFPYLVGWLYMLKYVAAAAFAFLWLKRYVRNPDYAVLGALLYAFSGFSHINLMYYHFHDIIAFFPLLLLSLDRLVLDGRRGWFALMTAVSALINYFFFFGQVIFLILYFITVYRFPSRKQRFRSFFHTLGEGFLGVLTASILLLPSALFILDSPKTGNFLQGIHLLLYGWDRYPALIKALLLPAEAMARQSSFSGYDFSSASLFLPAFSCSLVLAGFRRSPWKRLLAILAIMAAIPAFNALFTLMNSYYYARWFYMPTLILAAVTSQTLESVKSSYSRLWILRTLKLTLIFIFFSTVFHLIQKDIPFDRQVFLGSSLIAVAGLSGTWLIMRFRTRKMLNSLILWTAVISMVTGIYSIALIRSFQSREPSAFSSGYLFRSAEMELTPPPPENQQNYRTSSPYQGWNLSMLNHVPSVNSFITTISPSVHEFFDLVGVRHIAATVFPDDKDDILTFLSVRYRMDRSPHQSWLSLYSESNGLETFYITENPNFIPMGFPLDHYTTLSDLLTYPEEHRIRVLLQARLLEDEVTPPQHLQPYTITDFAEDLSLIALDKRSRAVTDYQLDSQGFRGTFHSDQTTTVLFTVPWDAGWKARIDDEPALIEKNAGFMTILVPPGTHVITFSYRIPGLTAGLILSVSGLAVILFLLYQDRCRKLRA